MSDLRLKLHSQIAGYLNERLDLGDLYRLVTDMAWEVERQGEPADAVDAVRSVQLFLEEFGHGDWNDDELRSYLRGVIGIGTEQEVEGGTASDVMFFQDTPFAISTSSVTADEPRFVDTAA